MDVVRNIVKGFRAEVGGRLLYFATSGATMVFLARFLEPNAYGMFFLAVSILSVGRLLSGLTIPDSAAKFVAEYGESDPDRLGPIVSYSFRIIAIATFVVVAGLLLLHGRIASLFDDPGLDSLLLVGTSLIVCRTLYRYFRMLLQGFKAIDYSAAVYAAEGVGRLAFVVAFVLLGYGVVGAVGGYALGSGIAAALGAVLFYRRIYPTIDTSRDIDAETKSSLLRYTVPLFASNGSKMIDSTFDTVLLGLLLNPAAVGYYVLGSQVVHFLQAPASAVGSTIGPWFGDRKASGEVERVSRIYLFTLVHALLIYVPIAAGLALLARPAIEILFGSDYLPAVEVFRIFAVLAVLWAFEEITDQALDYLGRARGRSIARTASALGSLALLVLLVPTYGVVGAAVAKVSGHAAYVLMTLYLMHSEVSVPLGRLSRQVAVIVLITAAMAIVVFPSVGFVSGPFSLAAVVALGGAVWGLLAVTTGVADVRTIQSYFS